ncbi:LuxR C-terminal-related transcriptional regulator [Sphingomonas sp. RB3P16]|uniref:LuxR C-terminal-related transcriptional regulator n=1 Tax=Parasphingomonas frigoris TaxID=3096163 RepID=UPI002FC5DCCF
MSTAAGPPAGSIETPGARNALSSTLAISEDTVKAHMRSISGKLGVTDRTHALTIAIKRGIINL